jgi:DNA oxidative demethylase
MRNNTTSADLFQDLPRPDVPLGPGAMVLAGFAERFDRVLLAAITDVTAVSPFRRLVTPGGFQMSVAMTNCGTAGWVSDHRGYRYDSIDPQSGRPWPKMPRVFSEMATAAAAAAGYDDFRSDVCLVNAYQPGTRLTLHQDQDERDHSQPIVSVSLGLTATFLWGGLSRQVRPRRIRLQHGDVAVWGGSSRLTYHGVDTIRDDTHPLTGAFRYNLTFRRAL